MCIYIYCFKFYVLYFMLINVLMFVLMDVINGFFYNYYFFFYYIWLKILFVIFLDCIEIVIIFLNDYVVSVFEKIFICWVK